MSQILKLAHENQQLKRQINQYQQVLGVSPYVDDSLFKGGYRVVKTIADRNAIKCCWRKQGMKVLVIGEDLSFKEYILKTDDCKKNIWEEVDVTVIVEEDEVFLIEDYSELSENLTTQKELNLILKQLILNLQTQIDNIELTDEKVQITENTLFAEIGQNQKDFNKNVSDYKVIIDNKNIEQDGKIENLEGVNYIWSPTNRTLTLFDKEGNQLSQVSLVSLDNEGTDLRYNATTLSLELYNENNELLDSIPVSSFVGSVGKQLQLNSNQLQLKDNQGNILSTANFTVSNINGLQTALDDKLDKGGYTGTAQDLFIKDEHLLQMIQGEEFARYYADLGLENSKQNKLETVSGNTGVGKTDASATEKLDVNGYTKSTGFKTPSGTANQSLTANGGTFDLNTKADLVGGKVPQSQSQGSDLSLDYTTNILKLTDASGDEKIVYLNNYEEVLIKTYSPTFDPSTDPLVGKFWFNITNGKVYSKQGLVWQGQYQFITTSEKTNYDTAYTHSQATGNPHNTTKADIGLGNVDNTSDLGKPVSNATQTALNLKLSIESQSTTGTSISFAIDRVYGTLDTPETGNITADVTNAKLGVTNIIIHNSGTAPTFGSGFKKLSGSGNYVTGAVNYIYCTFISNTEIIYSINQRT